MKRNLFVILIFLMLSSLSAQIDKSEDFYFASVEEEIFQLNERARNLGKSDPARQLKLALEAYDLALIEESAVNQADALATMGNAYFYLQEIDKSFQFLTDSLKLSTRLNYIEGLWYSNHSLGKLSRYIEDYEKAVFYFEEADSLLILEDDPRHIPSYRELAALYKKMELYERAVNYSDSALKLAATLNDDESLLLLTLLSGEIHFQAGDIRKAYNLFRTIIDRTATFGDYQNIRAQALAQKGKCHALLGDFHLALADGQDALLLSAKNDFLVGRVQAFDALAFIYYKMEDYEKAYENLQSYYDYKEISDKEANTESLSKIKAYYGTFEKEQEIGKQQVQIQLQNRLILIGSLMIAVFLILILTLYLLYRRNSKIAIRLSRELKEEITLSRTDYITGLPNKRDIEDKIQQCIIQWKKDHVGFSLIFISFESFRKIDKKMGEGTGKELQKHISRLLKIEVKGQDTVSLWKPFIFLLLLPETDHDSLQSVVHRIKIKISREKYKAGNREIDLTAKIGSCYYKGEGNRSDCIEKCRSELVST